MNMRVFLVSFFILVAALVLEMQAQNVTIDPSVEHQNIRGFGGMNHTTWIADLNEDVREKAFGNDPGQLGLSILRIHVDPNEQLWDLEIPTAQYAKSKNAIVFASPWNPPGELLDSNAAYNRIPESNYDAYVDHLNAFSKFMTDNGGDLYAISVQNEPDYGEPGGWTDWTSDEMLEFMKNHASKLNKRVMAPESFQFIRSFSDPILNDPIARGNLDIMGGHIYGGGLFDYPLARQYEKEVWMTEHYTTSNQSGNLWPNALEVGKEIHDCMQANFNAYVWWYIRRFYGLITDDGNISKRGYVFSQFSKFVRPNSKRIEVKNNTNLSVSAYKTGGALSIVVINQTASTVDLDMAILGDNVAALTKITTSNSMNMTNEGVMDLSDNRFVSAIAPLSITTFTTNASKAGKPENLNPVAFAGEDIITIDADIDGFELIPLDASSSVDEDGEIVNFSWALNGEQVSFFEQDEIEIPIGIHEIVLTITDNDGSRAFDTLVVEVKADESVIESQFWFEAECTAFGPNWQIQNSSLASNGSFINVNQGTQSLEAPTENTADHLVFTFEIPQDGVYRLWGRVRVPSADDDSFWVKMDDGDWILWNSITGGASWGWDDIHNSNAGGNAEVYNLSSGEHKLYITYREDGAELDKILVVNNSNVPTGLGEQDLSCTTATEELVSMGNLSIFPNPTSTYLNVKSEAPFNAINLRDISGRIVQSYDFAAETRSAELILKVSPGMYFVEVKGRMNTIKRLVVTNNL